MRYSRIALGVVLATVHIGAAQTTAPKLVRVQSGPSGMSVGDRYVLDSVRNRFVYPQDREVVVYFEWEATPGDHVLSATWKRPDGSVASVSSDVRVRTEANSLGSFWVFTIAPTLPPGTWSVDVRINGQPAGSHAFEIAGVATRMTLDEVFRAYAASVVLIHGLDDDGGRADVASGFVIGPNAVATAFQVIDTTPALEVEFADGRRAAATEVLAASRLGDWAILKVDTAAVRAIPRGTDPVPIGSRLAALVSDGDTRGVVPVSVGAVTPPSAQGVRVRFSPPVPAPSVGAPIIDESGQAVALLGGSMTPGLRVTQRAIRFNERLGNRFGEISSASSLAEIPQSFPASGSTLAKLRSDGLLTPLLVPMAEFFAGETTNQPVRPGAPRALTPTSEFSASTDPQLNVVTYWVKKDKVSRGDVSIVVYDAMNRQVGTGVPKRLSLRPDPQAVGVSIVPKTLPPGHYRLDVLWDGKPAWRTYVRIIP